MSELSPKVVAIIPARYDSTRFPGKPLAMIAGKPMIQHVYERVKQARKIEEVFVATDDDRIATGVGNFGGRYVMTSRSCRSGTDRCAEAAGKIGPKIVVNVQGDEPLISPATVDAVVAPLMNSDSCMMSTAAVLITNEESLLSGNVVKVVLDNNGDALYFSRNVIPSIRDANLHDYLKRFKFLKHLGIYAYRYDFLKKLTTMKETPLESAESLEQLRVLENGYKIRVAITEEDTISVDIPGDIAAVKEFLAKKNR